MISHKHRCIFVHVPKVAGVSVESVFLDDVGIEHRNRLALLLGANRRGATKPINLSHLKAAQYVEFGFLSDPLFTDYFKFAFVRHPANRAFSTYKYLGYSKVCTFEKYVDAYLPRLLQSAELEYFVCNQCEYTHHDSKQIVDFVGKFERLNDDFAQVAKEVGVSDELPHKNRTVSTPFRDVLKRQFRIQRRHGLTFPRLKRRSESVGNSMTTQTENTIKKIYEKDYEIFGY